jgi:hypothetical protein
MNETACGFAPPTADCPLPTLLFHFLDSPFIPLPHWLPANILYITYFTLSLF